MNLRAATKELRGRSPKISPQFLLLETLLVVGVSLMLVRFFA